MRLPVALRWPPAALRWPRPHPGWLVAGVLGLLLVAAVFGDSGILHLWRLRGEMETLHRDVQSLEAENERLSRAISELRHDPSAIERIAREELGLVRPGERVLRFPRSSRPDPVGGGPPAHRPAP